MASIRKVITAIDPNMEGKKQSVLRHLFGFLRRTVPNDPLPPNKISVSVLRQIDALRGPHIHINHYAIGWLERIP